DLDITLDIISNYFKKVLYKEGSEILNSKVIKDILLGIKKISLSNNIREVIDLKEFINPIKEEVNNNLIDIDKGILAQYLLENNTIKEDNTNKEET
ncbi:hypothetical protein ASPWEDRAFT_103543, partial [Aspergillus wentii DTO 134E9]